jgi:hypothetical protein
VRREDDQFRRATRQLVLQQGPRAAAWLLYTQRAKLHRAGAVDFHFKPGDLQPRYFSYAIALLRMRPRRWRVEQRDDEDGGKTYRVTWLGWHTCGPRWVAEASSKRAEAARRARNARKRANREWAR